MSSILTGLNESRSDWDSNMPGYQKREQDMMDYSKREFKRREMEHELGHEDEQERREQNQSWYIRLNGKLIKDKTGQPYSFRGKAAANKAALTMQAKLFNKGKEFMLTTNPNDKPQGVTEGAEDGTGSTYMQVKSLIDQMDKGGKKRIANALRKQLGQPISESKEDDEADYGPEYQAMVKRVGQMAKEGPRKTVWDPEKRVYKTVPINPPKQQGVAEDKWNPLTGGDFPTDWTGGELASGPSPAKWQAMLDYHGNNMNVIRALDDLYRNAQSGSYYDSTVRQDRYLATIENRFGKSEKRYFPTKQEAYAYAKGYNSVVTSIEKIDREEDTSDLITLPVMLGIKDHKKKWMLKFPSEDYAQKWEFKHKNVAKILWDEQHALHSPEPEVKPKTEKDQEDDEPGKYGYDTETGRPLKKGEKSSKPQPAQRPPQAYRPQQSASPQLGSTKPSKYSKDDVTDVEVKEDEIDAVKRAVDNKGRTQRQWVQAVKAKFPGAKITQAKMIDGPMQATLPDGRKLSWSKVEQNVTESVDYKTDAEELKRQGNMVGYHKTMVRYYDALADNAEHRGDAKRYEALANKHHAASKNVAEGWSQKYKNSINCSHPKGFSQKAHCAGKKKHNESVEMEMTCPDCGMCETHSDHENLDEACWKGYHKEGNKKMFGKTYPNCVKNEGVAKGLSEMDKSQTPPGRDGHVSHGTYGSRDKKDPDAGKKQYYGKMERPEKTTKTASDILNKAFNKEGVTEDQHSCPHCGGEMVSEELMNEKKDACYYKVKSRYKVWPSAYASGALVKCRKKGADSWGNGGKKNESSILEGIERADESLHDWFTKEKWVRMDTKGKIKGPCAREPGEGKPKCLPQSKAHSLGKKGRASAAQRKRREDPNPDRHGSAINVNTKKKSNENIGEGWREKLGAAALVGSMALGAAGAHARVTPDGQGGFTGGLKPTATVTAPDNTPSATAPTASSDTSDPFKGLVRADSADRQAKTITVDGKEYGLVEISPTDIRPRGGQRIVVPQAVLGERGIGNYTGILVGDRVFVISK